MTIKCFIVCFDIINGFREARGGSAPRDNDFQGPLNGFKQLPIGNESMYQLLTESSQNLIMLSF